MRQIIAFVLLLSMPLLAYTPSSEAEISILTCSSGKEIYKIYGHSAIRFQDKAGGKDFVFNYGMFDFSAPNFVLRYLQGQNNYLLGVETFKRFNRRYELGGENVTEQVLNLDSAETNTLYKALTLNAKDENRTYLYNVFYDNCATRVYKIIENNIEDGVKWEKECQDYSFRTSMHRYNHIMPFSQMGIDMVFGTKADKTISCMEQMYLPELLMEGVSQAKIHDQKPLIKETRILLVGKEIHNNKELYIFNLAFILILALALAVRFKAPRFIRVYRIILYSILGLMSLVVSFIAFFSIHPTVLPNLSLIWINPLWLIFAVLMILQKVPKIKTQKLLNAWSVIMAIYLITGLAGLFYIHYGFIYIISTIVILSFHRLRS